MGEIADLANAPGLQILFGHFADADFSDVERLLAQQAQAQNSAPVELRGPSSLPVDYSIRTERRFGAQVEIQCASWR